MLEKSPYNHSYAGSRAIFRRIFFPYGTEKAILFFILLSAVFSSPVSADNCDQAWQWYNRGLALSDSSDREVFCYRQAMELCPDLLEARLRLGQLYRDQGNLDLASFELQKTVTLILASDFFLARPGSRDMLLESMLALGEVYRLQGRLELAEDQYSRILQIFPDSPAAQNNLQYVSKRLHRYDMAMPPRFNLLTNPPFTRISGYTLPKGKFLFDTFYRYWTQKAPFTKDMFDGDFLFIPPEERTAYINLWAAGLRYGLTDRLSIGVVAKYFKKKVDIDFRVTGDSADLGVSGFGDTVIMIKYHLWGKRKRHLSIYNLLSIPNGDDNAIGRDSEVWRWIPLGSGSFDFTPGLAFTADIDPVIANMNFSYRITDGENVGDELNFGVALTYPWRHSVFASLEFDYRWRDDMRMKQHMIVMKARPDTLPFDNLPTGPVSVTTWITEKGGHTFFVSPGMQFFVARGLKMELGVKVPVIKPDKGWAEDCVLHVGISKAFF